MQKVSHRSTVKYHEREHHGTYVCIKSLKSSVGFSYASSAVRTNMKRREIPLIDEIRALESKRIAEDT